MANISKIRQTAIALLAACSIMAIAQPSLAQTAVSAPKSAAAASAPITFKPFRRGISQTVQLPAGLQDVRRRLIAGRSLRTSDLRALADAGDSLAQMRFAKQLSEMSDPTLVRAQVHYFAMAAYNGRDGAVRPLLSLLRTQGATLDAAVLSNAEIALQAQATHGQIDAISGLGKFYLAGAPFGLKSDEGMEMMTKVAKAGDYQAALDLALQLIGDRQNLDNIATARGYLEIAANSPEPALRAMALSLLDSNSEI